MMKMQKIFATRKETIKKKARELASRCNADVCVLFFSPDGRPDQWPQDPRESQPLSDVLDSKIKALRRQLHARPDGAFGFPLWEEELALLPKESLLALSSCLNSNMD